MSFPFPVPREAVEKKPPHGLPCTRCGVCCMASLCELGKHIFGDRHGPCPALQFNDKRQSSCGIVALMSAIHDDEKREAALELIGADTGCDCRINGEPVNHAFNAFLEERDRRVAVKALAARKSWGLD